MFRLLITFLAISTTFICQNAFAARDSWFEVEIYIFSQQNKTQEKWPEKAIPASTANSIDIITPLISTNITGISNNLRGCSNQDWITRSDWCNNQIQISNKSFPAKVPNTIAASTTQYAQIGQGTVLLADSQSQFNSLINKLSKRKGINSLLHMTWQQHMLSKPQTKPIRIYAGIDFGKEFKKDGSPIIKNNQIIHFLNLNDQISKTINRPVWQLDGTLNIYLDHYLYIETNLVLRQKGEKTHYPMSFSHASSVESIDEIGSPNDLSKERITEPFLYAIHMTQNRRVRSNEIHYFDHPALGMIIQIRKMTQPTS